MADTDCTLPTKACTKCGETKPLNEFYRRAAMRLGRASHCRLCHKVAYFKPRVIDPDETATHKRCPYCHERQPRDLFIYGHRRCKPCRRAREVQWAKENPEKARALRQRRLAKLRARTAATLLAQAQEPAIHRQCRICQALLPIESFRVVHKTTGLLRRRYECISCANAISAAYFKTHPDKNRAFASKRRALEAAVTVNDLTEEDWRDILAAFEHRCAYCRRKMQRLTMDHITPISKGGNHTKSNIVPACRSCNSKKYTGPPLTPVQPLLL